MMDPIRRKILKTGAAATAMARETVIVWLDPGKLRVTQGGGAATVSDVKAGTMRHMTRGSNETVEIVGGSPRAILFQLK